MKLNNWIKYLLFFLQAALCFGIASQLAARVFSYMDYGEKGAMIRSSSFILYAIYFIIVYFFATIPLTAFYYFIYTPFNEKDIPWLRFLGAVFFGLLAGLALKDNGYSLYIGQYREEKQIVSCVLTFLLIETTRSVYFRFRKKNRCINRRMFFYLQCGNNFKK